MNINKIASKDAARMARADMFFGEGAGTRRKLLNAEIGHKVENISGYYEAFKKAYDSQNMAEHAIKAAKERKHIDRVTKVTKNTRALVRGDWRGFSTGIAVISGVVYIAHQTGYDKVILIEGKKRYKKIKSKVKYELAKRKIAKDPRNYHD